MIVLVCRQLEGFYHTTLYFHSSSNVERLMASISGTERTEVLYGTSSVIDKELQLFSRAKNRVDTCMDHTRPSLALGIESIRKSFLDAKNRDVKLRYITEITTENISYCKEIMKIVHDLRHLDGIKGKVNANMLLQQLHMKRQNQQLRLSSVMSRK